MRGSLAAGILFGLAAAFVVVPGSGGPQSPPIVPLQFDSDGDGVPDLSDCRPFDNTLWSIPSPAIDLTISSDPVPALAWSAPAQPGGQTIFYDVLVSGAAGDWGVAGCVEVMITATGTAHAGVPPPGQALFYLVRARNACGTNMGSGSDGIPRTGAACGPFPKPDGAPCNTDPLCSSGFCTDGVCCETRCDAGCASCGEPGREGFCDPWPAGTVCVEPYCASPTTSEQAWTCDGFGSCVRAGEVECPPYACDEDNGVCFQECAEARQCAPSALCDPGTSWCRYAVGHACASDFECMSGFCTDGVCCESRCDGLCERCDPAGRAGFCDPLPSGTDPDGECEADPLATCDRTGACSGGRACEVYAPGTVCAAASCASVSTSNRPDQCDGAGTCVDMGVQDCRPYACDAGSGACFGSCASNAQCAPVATCHTISRQCLLNDGQTCTDHMQCVNHACCGGTCTNLLTDINNCAACGRQCVNPHGTTSCYDGNCHPLCTGPWLDCDSNVANGCETSILTIQNCGYCGHVCVPPANTTASCPSAFCQFTCNSGYCDIQNGMTDGCEVALDPDQNSCGTATWAGRHSGDSMCGIWPVCSAAGWDPFFYVLGRGSQWHYAEAEEISSCTGAIYARVTLTSPAGTDYDLYVYGPCGTLLGSSVNPAGVLDEVIVSRPDNSGSDDSFYYYVYVSYYSGSGCGLFELDFEGRNCH